MEENQIRAAIFGDGAPSQKVNELIYKNYNPYMEGQNPPVDGICAMCYVTVDGKPTTASSGEGDIPVISIQEFLLNYQKGIVEVLLIPMYLYFGASFLVTELLRLGVDREHIYLVERHFLEEEIRKEESPEIFSAFMDAPYLPYLEFHVADHCNLNCKACEHYSPLVKEEVFTDPGEFEKTLGRLKEFINDIGMIRVLGGEPLLHPKLSEFLRISAKYYPHARRMIVTNGLLLFSMSEELLSAIKETGTGFAISLYPPMAHRADEMRALLEKEGIFYEMSPEISQFTIKQNLTGDSDITSTFYACQQAHCHNIYRGRISACFLPFVTHYFNETFQKDLPEGGDLNLFSEPMSTRRIKEVLLTPLERCRFCGAPVPVDWQQASKEPTLSDWVQLP